MKASIILCALILSFTSVFAQTNPSNTDTKEQYLMMVVSTSYSAVVGGTSITIYSPESENPVIVKQEKKENMKVRVLKEINALASQGWTLADVQHQDFQVSGESGTSSMETTYLFKKRTL